MMKWIRTRSLRHKSIEKRYFMLFCRGDLSLLGTVALILQHVWAFECWTTTEIIITMSTENMYERPEKFAFPLLSLCFIVDSSNSPPTPKNTSNSSLKKKPSLSVKSAVFTFDLCQAYFHIHNIIIFIRKFQSIHWIFIIIHHPSTLIFIVYGWSDHTRNMKAADRTTKRREKWTIICAIADISRRDRCGVSGRPRERFYFTQFFLTFLFKYSHEVSQKFTIFFLFSPHHHHHSFWASFNVLTFWLFNSGHDNSDIAAYENLFLYSQNLLMWNQRIIDIANWQFNNNQEMKSV